MPRIDLLMPLDHLAYLHECAVIDCAGDLKGELSNLCTFIGEKRNGYNAAEVQASLPALKEALRLYQIDKKIDGASILSSVSRQWWKAINS